MRVALATGQPIGDLIDILGLPREWPELFDIIVDLLDNQDRKARRSRLTEMARQRFGG